MKILIIIISLVFYSMNIFSQQNVIFINELMAKNDSFLEDDKGNFSDWIEIYNSSSDNIDIGGYYLTDDLDTLNMWKIPTGTTITSKGFMIFWASGDNKGKHTNFGLSVSGEKIALVMPDAKTLVDTVKFPEQSSNISYGRTTDGAKNWIFFEEPTPNEANTKPNSEVLPIVINELMASNSKTIQDETGAYPDWIELYNNSNEKIDISGFYLTDKPLREPSMWRIPNETILNPHSYLLVWADSDPEDGAYHTNFNLGKDEDSVAIYSVDGKTLVDIVSYSNQQTDESWGRRPDGEPSWMIFTNPTPGTTNNPIAVDDYSDNFDVKNYPNPFQNKTIFEINLESQSDLSVEITNMLGRIVHKMNFNNCNSGIHKIEFDRNNLNSGIYFYNIKVNGKINSGKFIIE